VYHRTVLRLYLNSERSVHVRHGEGDMSAEMTLRRFQRGDATASEIQDVAREVLAELRRPGTEANATARTAGLDPGTLADARTEVTDGEQGVEPVLTTIVVGIAVSAGSKVAESLWKDVLWPRIRRRLGVRALGVEKTPEDATEREG
jgi:hypothetical protein